MSTRTFGLEGLPQYLGTTGETVTLSGNGTVSDEFPWLLKFDPGGSSRDITLPLDATRVGALRVIVNAADAAENLVVKDDNSSGAVTVCTINQNEAAVIVQGATAHNLVCVVTIALA